MSLRGILSEIETERQCQDARWGGPDWDDLHTPAQWLAIIMRHLGLAADDGASIDFIRMRKQLVRVAALSVAAVESLDRSVGTEHTAGPTAEQRGPGF